MAEPKVIAYLTGCYARATDTFVRNEVLRLRERGHTVHTFSIRRAEESQRVSEEVRREQISTTYIVPDQLAHLPMAALRMLVREPRAFWRAARLALRTRPPGLRNLIWQIAYLLEASYLAEQLQRRGVRHVHNHIAENSATVAMLASVISGVPYSLTVHGPYIFRAPERWALGEKIVRSAFTACISEFTKSQCMIYVPYACWSRLQVVRCGPDPAFLSSEPPPIPVERQLIWVGRICEEKGVALLLEAAERVAAHGLDFRLVLVGDGQLRPAMEDEIRSRGLAGHATITGWLGSDEVRAELASARALVLPSFAEGLPIVLMEAMALGRPVISTYVAGIPELVDPGVNGWLVPAGSVERLAEAMHDVLKASPERLRNMGLAGRRAVLRLHDPAVEIEKLEGLIARAGSQP